MTKHFFAFFTMCLAIIGICVVTSCSNDDPDVDCTGTAPTYTADIKPIFDVSCAASGCHSSTEPAGGIDLSSYTASKAAGNTVDVSCAIEHGSDCEPMPQGGTKLSDDQIKKINCWIQNGMPE